MKLTEEQEKEIIELLTARRKIEAIKVYRESTGVGLKEAKEAVERMQRGKPAAAPAETGSTGTHQKAKASGCGAAGVFLLLLAVVLSLLAG